MPYMTNGKRDYKKQRENYDGTPEQMANNRKRKKARRKLEKEGKVHPHDGKDVDHKTPLKRGGGNGDGNLRVQEASKNRSVRKTKKNRMKGNG
jgi:hypothetical protein